MNKCKFDNEVENYQQNLPDFYPVHNSQLQGRNQHLFNDSSARYDSRTYDKSN